MHGSYPANTDCIKDVKWLDQLRAGLYAEVASRWTQIKRSQSSLGSLEEIHVFTYRLENRMKGDFLKQ